MPKTQEEETKSLKTQQEKSQRDLKNLKAKLEFKPEEKQEDETFAQAAKRRMALLDPGIYIQQKNSETMTRFLNQ